MSPHLDAIGHISILPRNIKRNVCEAMIISKYGFMYLNIFQTLELASVSFIIASFFLRSQITQRCEKVDAKITSTEKMNELIAFSFNIVQSIV